MRIPRNALVPLVVLSAVLAVGFHRLIATPGSLIVDARRPNVDHSYRGRPREVGNDLTSVFLPRFCYVVGQIRATGKAPTWDALGFGGRPLVGNPQAGWNYPPVWLAWRVGQPGVLGWLTVAHLAWAGLGAYVLSRALGFGRLPAVIAGACFELSPYLIAHTFEGHYPHVWAACWYPWAFWAMSLCLKRNPVGYWSLPLVVAMTLLAGHPQEWYYLVVVLTGWAVYEAFREWRSGGSKKGVVLLATWFGLLGLSLALCAADLIPQLTAGGWSLKAGTIPLAQMNRYRLHSINLFQLLSPLALGGPQDYFGEDNYWETVLSIGLAPLVLAVIGAAGHPNRSATGRLLVLVLLAGVFAAGKQLGLYTLAYAVLPGMERFRVPARTLFLASLGTSVLAGAGVDRLLLAAKADLGWKRLRFRLRSVLFGIAALVIAAASVCSLTWGPGRRAPDAGRQATASREGHERVTSGRELRALAAVAGSPGFWIGLAGMMGVLAFVGLGERGRRIAAWGLGSVAVLELTCYAQGLLVCSPPSAFLGGDKVGRAIREAEGGGARPVRIATFGTVYPDLRAAAIGLEKTNINDGFQIQHAADLYERLYPLLDAARPRVPTHRPMDDVVEEYRGRVAQAALDLMSVRYLVTDRPLPLPRFETTARVGSRGGELTLWENRTPMPLAYVVPRAVVSETKGGKQRPWLVDFKPRETVLMKRDPLPAGTRQPFTPAEWDSRDPDEVVIHVQTEAPGLLVVGNTWMPGWSATVDARAATVHRGNHWQQVVALPGAGRHEVVLRYVPPGLAAGSAISAAVLVTWSGFGLALVLGFLRAPVWEWRPGRAARPALTAYRSA